MRQVAARQLNHDDVAVEIDNDDVRRVISAITVPHNGVELIRPGISIRRIVAAHLPPGKQRVQPCPEGKHGKHAYPYVE